MAEVAVKRDVQHPILFECAWEVANKGGLGYHVAERDERLTPCNSSRRHLHCYQDKGTSHTSGSELRRVM
jgi:hypothetical protein